MVMSGQRLSTTLGSNRASVGQSKGVWLIGVLGIEKERFSTLISQAIPIRHVTYLVWAHRAILNLPNKSQHHVYINKMDCDHWCFPVLYPSCCSRPVFRVNVGPKGQDQNLLSKLKRTLAPRKMAWLLGMQRARVAQCSPPSSPCQ